MSAKRRAELTKAINARRTIVIDLLAKNDLEAAKAASKELAELQAELDAIKDDNVNNNFKPINGGITMTKNERRAALNAAVTTMLRRGYQALDENQRKLIMPLDAIDSPGNVEGVNTRGGVLVPVETADIIAEMPTGAFRLKDRCDYFPTGTASGTIPAGANPTEGLVDFDELPAGGMPASEVTFTPINFTIHNKGEIVKVSNQLLADTNTDLMGYIMRNFVKKQVISENNAILAVLDAGEAKAGTTWKDVIGAINKDIPLGAAGRAVIVTNQDGWNYLDTCTDEAGRPLLTLDLRDSARWTFKGYEVIVIGNDILATDATDGIPFYCGSLLDAVMFVERLGLEIAVSEHAAFNQYAVAVRVVARFDVESKFANAVKKVNLKVA